jgi:hypothetical protein
MYISIMYQNTDIANMESLTIHSVCINHAKLRMHISIMYQNTDIANMVSLTIHSVCINHAKLRMYISIMYQNTDIANMVSLTIHSVCINHDEKLGELLKNRKRLENPFSPIPPKYYRCTNDY